MKILHIVSSARQTGSLSRQISTYVVERLQQSMPESQVVLRDLGADPLPHVDQAFVRAMFIPPEDRTEHDDLVLARSEALISELMSAAIVVIGTPMYNYGVPSALKAWIDHVVRARRTFQHTPDGPVGLLVDRPVFVVSSSGACYSAPQSQAVDFLTPYLKTILQKIGLRNITFIRAEGSAVTAIGADRALDAAIAAVNAAIPLPVAA